MNAPVSLRGGSTGICADLDQLADLAARLGRTSDELAHSMRPPLLRLGWEPALLAAAPFDPVGAAEIAERSVACLALLVSVTAVAGLLDAGLRTAVRAYRQADELDRRLLPAARAAWLLPAALSGLQLGGSRPGGWRPPGLQRVVTADPQLADVGVDAISLAIAGPPGLLRLDGVAAVLAKPYPDGSAIVTARAELPTADELGAPRSVADLVRGVAVRAGTDDGGGAIDVRTLQGPPPAGRRAIVDIAGTTVWNVNPLRTTPQASDLGTNLRALANEPSVLERGVRQALQQAGVGPGEPIMLVGHSQGGMIAARLAADLSATGEFQVTHLVTAGSPIGLVSLPPRISVLALENQGDPVPQFDGADNPDRPNWLTAQIDRGADTVLDKHDVHSYLQGAADLDRCPARSIADWRAGASDFLTAATVRTQVFQVRRGP